jgi:hypothetical protein
MTGADGTLLAAVLYRRAWLASTSTPGRLRSMPICTPSLAGSRVRRLRHPGLRGASSTPLWPVLRQQALRARGVGARREVT